jgi:hypothetical protein
MKTCYHLRNRPISNNALYVHFRVSISFSIMLARSYVTMPQQPSYVLFSMSKLFLYCSNHNLLSSSSLTQERTPLVILRSFSQILSCIQHFIIQSLSRLDLNLVSEFRLGGLASQVTRTKMVFVMITIRSGRSGTTSFATLSIQSLAETETSRTSAWRCKLWLRFVASDLVVDKSTSSRRLGAGG